MHAEGVRLPITDCLHKLQGFKSSENSGSFSRSPGRGSILGLVYALGSDLKISMIPNIRCCYVSGPVVHQLCFGLQTSRSRPNFDDRLRSSKFEAYFRLSVTLSC